MKLTANPCNDCDFSPMFCGVDADICQKNLHRPLTLEEQDTLEALEYFDDEDRFCEDYEQVQGRK